MGDDFKTLEVDPRLPHSVGGGYGDDARALFKSMQDARIVTIGAPDTDQIEGGGLVIDFIAAGDTAVRRVVFGFNECGMWVEYDSRSDAPAA